MRLILTDPDYVMSTEDIQLSAAMFQEMLEIRYSSPLFRLPTSEAIQSQVTFHNTGPDQIPGVIVMAISDIGTENLDPEYAQIVVVFNGRDEPVDFTASAFAGSNFELHPVLQESADVVVQTAVYDKDAGTFSVPALTTAVFVLPE